MGNTNLIVFKGAKHKAEAKAFVSYLMKDENYLRYVLTDPSAFGPVTKSAQESAAYKDSPQLKAVREIVDAVFAELPNAWVYGMPNPHAGEIEGLTFCLTP